jgi:hypothetical protein
MMARSFLNGRVTKGDDRPVSIYALCEAGTGVVRYVGKTVDKPNRRLIYHIQQAKRPGSRPISRWLRKRLEDGRRPTVTTLEVVPPGEDWAGREKHWISHYRSTGAPRQMLNLTDGGEGISGHKFAGTEHAKKIGETQRRGSYFACETCGAKFFRKPKEIRKGDCRFCSRSCYAASRAGKHKPISPEVHAKGIAASAAQQRARLQCKNGHAFTPENTRLRPGTRTRICRACLKDVKARTKEARYG